MAYVRCNECGAEVSERDRLRCPECGYSESHRRCVECLYSTYYDEDGDYSCSFGIRVSSGNQSACVHFTYDDSD